MGRLLRARARAAKRRRRQEGAAGADSWRERGAALVEAAIVTPLVLLLVFGVAEAGYAFYGRLTVDNMSVVGARAAAGGANDVLADFGVLQAIKNASSGLTPNEIQLVIVYRATGPNDSVPEQCKTGSVTNSSGTRGCNRYVGSDLQLASNQFGCVGPPGPVVKVDSYWCPTTRKTALLSTSSNGPPDYIGVFVQGKHLNLTPIFGTQITFTADTVMRVEPRTLR